ncbi:MAG: hypothetical protein AAGF19_10320 [Pseudomonadota bacterium]
MSGLAIVLIVAAAAVLAVSRITGAGERRRKRVEDAARNATEAAVKRRDRP